MIRGDTDIFLSCFINEPEGPKIPNFPHGHSTWLKPDVGDKEKHSSWVREKAEEREKIIIKGKAKQPSAVSCLLGSGFVGCCYCVNTWRNLRKNQICYENLLHNNNINAYPDGKLWLEDGCFYMNLSITPLFIFILFLFFCHSQQLANTINCEKEKFYTHWFLSW